MASSHKVQPIERFPTKPRADGRFQKRINGRLYYFGRDGDRNGALIEYDRVKHDLYAGRRPRAVTDPATTTVKQLANLFTDEKEAQTAAGDITPGHMADIRDAIHRFLKYVGGARTVSDLRPDDFAGFRRSLRKTLGSYAYNRVRACVVSMFNHADSFGWIEHPVRFGKGFEKDSDSVLRGLRKRRLLDQKTARKLIDGATGQMKAMILLGLNAGFGATDCSILERQDVHGDRIKTERRKRHVLRLVPLWSETAAALDSIKSEREKDALVFRKADGAVWVRESETANVNDVINAFNALCSELNITRPDGVSFNVLRHTFATHANEVNDPEARKVIMGHKLPGMDDRYVNEVFWRRLKRVTDHVHSEIFSSPGNDPSQKPSKTKRAARSGRKR